MPNPSALGSSPWHMEQQYQMFTVTGFAYPRDMGLYLCCLTCSLVLLWIHLDFIKCHGFGKGLVTLPIRQEPNKAFKTILLLSPLYSVIKIICIFCILWSVSILKFLTSYVYILRTTQSNILTDIFIGYVRLHSYILITCIFPNTFKLKAT